MDRADDRSEAEKAPDATVVLSPSIVPSGSSRALVTNVAVA